MSLERYFAICHPLYSRQWQTLSHAYKTIAACWLLAFAVVIPIAIYTKLVSTWNGQIHFCREIWPTKLGSQSYTVFLDWILLIVPILIMSCSYGLIVRTLWLGIKMDEKIQKDAEKSKKKEKENVKMIVCNETTKINQGGDLKKHAKKYTENNPRHDGADRKQISKRNPKRKCNQSVTPNHNSNLNLSSSSQHRKHRRLTGGGGVRQSNMGKSVTTKKRVIKMLCVIVLEFFVCWCPLFCVQTWKAFDPRGIRRHLTAVGMNSIYLLAYLSSCCNPITYCFMNKSFRKAFLATFHCVTKRLPGGKDQQRHRHQQLQLLQLEMQDQQQQQQQQQQQEKDQQLQQKQKEQEYEEQQQQQQQQQQHRHLLQQHCHLEKQHDLESEVSTETTKFEPENTSTEADTVETFDNDDDDDDAVNTFSSDSESFSKQSD
ncbi:cholecystokinin receptor type A [Octopus bimaculoides]|uniref:G-protein coupled receptors family 1 profile domain-containing protein n=1 Tax=Octopus bimaculoides TaxID=37653 RepID=A0A0L8GHG6_OCTBM|nr:cholecystokinin receptor type A [Octopus bimaculoides]XP_052833258.1 cholecystokinin receptor type A [Octopus bimaculoides]XP_052833259.1 cholecystokinin receptor type A [Octopus bimaculoides]XP_052833260.1 cholecystokinin receptor type A [Octopus bimaculoides]XP_052833261.1 cholecystokinin receptor type A [Octopus bimaculoides]XP_052833262.1 cholecystokinin receptor type A [Octopus bimaculoides]|eukprot:XP_014781012.1 PREDICTED: cholecystokinin receptor type A-like [Octopus bimaculoides]